MRGALTRNSIELIKKSLYGKHRKINRIQTLIVCETSGILFACQIFLRKVLHFLHFLVSVPLKIEPKPIWYASPSRRCDRSILSSAFALPFFIILCLPAYPSVCRLEFLIWRAVFARLRFESFPSSYWCKGHVFPPNTKSNHSGQKSQNARS